MKNKYSTIETAFTALSFIIIILLILFLILLYWPHWWKGINSNNGPLDYVQTGMLLLSSLCALACGVLSFKKNAIKNGVFFSVMSAGFLYLSIDERIGIHRILRDKIFAPAKIKIPFFPWTAYGDFVLLITLVIGLALIPFFWKLLARRKAVLFFFLAAVVVSVCAVGMDSIDMAKFGNMAWRMEQFAEELLETLADILFLNSFFYSLMLIFRDKNST